MTRFLTVLFLLVTGFVVIPAGLSQGIIKGRVYDIQISAPLPSATVVYGRGRGTVTDTEGNYLLEVEPGNIDIVFRYVGYSSVTRTVFVSSSDTVILDVGLDYDVAEIDQIVVSAGKDRTTGGRADGLDACGQAAFP
jgi:hypothetical protein